MPKDIFISLVIPAFNEAQRIVETLGEAVHYFESRNYSFEIIVSADGQDGTRERAAELAARDPRICVTGDNERRGKGFGIRRAVCLAKGSIVGFTDADNKTPITELDKFMGPLSEGNEVVIGSRCLGARIEHPQPLYRRLGSRGFGIFMHSVVGLKRINDTQCGFKFFRRDAAICLFAKQKIDGYMFDVEILCLAEKAGYRIVQIPVRWRDDADSRLQLVRGNLQNVKDIFRIYSMHRRSKPQSHEQSTTPDKAKAI
ncbi:MAG: dolichyl-phosphate beta-glucosyltransferase [bacterium]